MAKSYESLILEAGDEEFENMANQTSEKEKAEVRSLSKVKRTEDARPLSLSFGRSTPREISLEDVEHRLVSRGKFEEVVTVGNFEEKLTEQEALMDGYEHELWAHAAADFGDPFKFKGNPFDRAKELQKQLIECAAQAEEIMQSEEIMYDVEPEEVEVTEGTDKINSTSIN